LGKKAIDKMQCPPDRLMDKLTGKIKEQKEVIFR